MAVWVVVGIIGVGAIGLAVASRRHTSDVEPTVREFAEFRDALSQQVAPLRSDTRTARRHLDRAAEPRVGEADAG
ncbi:MAG TPA: hypothetical protein VEP49_04715 [Acidimicrobiia bacterium]|nr:hypothetical protein [Acidimicrobiia bacterium]